jgi:glutamate-5-semialdehyde dehydrogenase
MSMVRDLALSAKAAARRLAAATEQAKNHVLELIAQELWQAQDEVLAANQVDIQNGAAAGMSPALLDRLALNPERLQGMVAGVRQVMALPDPIGEVLETWQRPNGLVIEKVRVPMGVIGMIYEGRPNVTVDASALCLKAGSAALLRGSASALESNRALVGCIKRGLAASEIPPETVQLIDIPERSAVDEMLRLNGILDLVIPRGGAGLIQRVIEQSTVPVIETGVGNCHLFVDDQADLKKALPMVINAKCQRYGVCNTIESLLVHKGIAPTWLPVVVQALVERGVEVRGCPVAREIVPEIKEATESDWATEFLAPIIAIKVVNGVQEAVEHIAQYGTNHSEGIITENHAHARTFLEQVDAAVVYHNASTRFTDGFEFGFGAEIGISTQKLHARGPMGLREITSYKYMVHGNGQVRP